MSNYTLHLGDCLEVMPCIPAGSVDAIIADWPYGTTACKWDSVIPLEPLWKECKRVIKKNGAIVLTASQPFTSTLVINGLGLFKDALVWDKIKPSTGLHANQCPLNQHEDILIFGMSTVCYNPIMRYAKHRVDKPRVANNGDAFGGKDIYRQHSNNGVSYPRSIIQISNANQNNRLHPTQKPVALMEYLIKTYTNPGDLVLDNTMGSGSTGEACLRTGRRFIGIEKDPGYFEIAKNRLEKVERELREEQIARERQPYLMAEVVV